MPTIVIMRSSEYMNRMKPIKIMIDGQNVDAVSNGEMKQIPVSAGSHTLKTTIDWRSSPELTFNIADGETKNFKLSGFKGASWLMPVALGIIVANLILKYTLHIRYFMWALLPIAIVVLYNYTLGRSKYLQLISDDVYNPDAKKY